MASIPTAHRWLWLLGTHLPPANARDNHHFSVCRPWLHKRTHTEGRSYLEGQLRARESLGIRELANHLLVGARLELVDLRMRGRQQWRTRPASPPLLRSSNPTLKSPTEVARETEAEGVGAETVALTV